jgi:hypothetical protein
MQTYHAQSIRHGLRAPQPAPDFLARILAMAEEGLRRRDMGEERLLAPLWRRLDRRLNPAQQARAVYRADGMAGLLAHTAIRPEMTIVDYH